MESPTYRLDVFESLAVPLRVQIFDFLLQQFNRIQGEHPADQFLTPEQYGAIADSDSTFVIACLDQDDELAGAALVTREIHAIEWASGRFFDSIYSGTESETPVPVFFIASLGVRQNVPPQVLNSMIDRLTDIVAEVGGVAVADFADRDRKYSLAKHIAGRVAMRYESDWRSLGSQTYHAFRPGRQLTPITTSAAKRLISHSPDGPGILRK